MDASEFSPSLLIPFFFSSPYMVKSFSVSKWNLFSGKLAPERCVSALLCSFGLFVSGPLGDFCNNQKTLRS